MAIVFLVFVFGLIIGSFLNSLIFRLETGRDFIFARSICPHCQHRLAWYDLIPLWSFLFLAGRCRYCQKPIAWQYPLVELATAVIFVLVYFFVFQNQPQMINFAIAARAGYYLMMAALLIAVFVYDLKHYLIPDEIIYSGIAFSLTYRLFETLNNWGSVGNLSLAIRNFEPLLNPLAAALLASLFFFAIYFFSRGRGLGFGDVKLVFLMGLFLGLTKTLVALAFAFFSGALLGIILLLAKKKSLKSELPFAPFLVSGAFFALFFGRQVVDYYLRFLLF